MSHRRYIVIKLILSLVSVVMAVAGCGYKFSGGGTLPSGTGVVCVSIFNNRTSEPMVENILANDLIYEFTRNGQNVSKTAGEADSVMTGEVMSVLSETVTHTESLTSIESRVTMTLSARLKDHQGKILWENSRITDSEVYTVDSDNVVDSAGKREALKKISARFASKIYAELTEDF